jgi:hypothetical protein
MLQSSACRCDRTLMIPLSKQDDIAATFPRGIMAVKLSRCAGENSRQNGAC